MNGPFPVSERRENYERDYKPMKSGLNTLLMKTKTDAYVNIGCWRNQYFLMCSIGTFSRKLLWELHHEQNEKNTGKIHGSR
jgi:hypothetical protein